MSTKPTVKNLSGTTVDVFNAIRNSSSETFRNSVPRGVGTPESIRTIGDCMMEYEAIRNEFLSTLWNRIARVIITSKSYTNSLRMFKRGLIDYGETIEEIYVNLAASFDFPTNDAENNVFKKVKPDVKAAFHSVNYQKFYKTTVSEDMLRKAFTSWDELGRLIQYIIDSLYKTAEFDEFVVTKYLIARQLLAGKFKVVDIPAATSDNMKEIVATIKGVSNDFEFLSDAYNPIGVHNNSLKANQYLLVNSSFDAHMDVDVLAAAFNMDKAEFMGHRVLVDGFGKLNTAKLAELLGAAYIPISDAELAALNEVPAVLVDVDYLLIYDYLNQFKDIENPEGLYWNYFHHVWRIFSASPFANRAAFVPGEASVTSVTISPATATSTVGQNVQFTADVVTVNFAPKSVVWNVTGEGVAVNSDGVVTIPTDFSGESITVTATSTFDSTKSDTATITIV